MYKKVIILFSFSILFSQNSFKSIHEDSFKVSSNIPAKLNLLSKATNISSSSNPYFFTFAGSGTAGSIDSTGTNATFGNIEGISLDSKGNIFVAGLGNNLIRKITPEGVVTTFAGSGAVGSSDGTGIAATFNGPSYMAIDSLDNIYLTDIANHLIRKITPDAVVTTFAGSGTKATTDGTGTAASFNSPWGIAIDSNGNLFVSELAGHVIRKITPSAVVTTFAGSGTAGSVDSKGILASFKDPMDIDIDSNNNIFVGDRGNHKIRKITSEGVVTTFAGSGTVGSVDSTGILASFNHPDALTIDSKNNIYVADFSNDNIRKITPEGLVTTFINSDAGFDGLVGIDIASDDRSIYFAEFSKYKITKVFINTPVVIDAINDISINEDESTTISLITSDADGDSITFFLSEDSRTELRFDGEDDYVAIPDNANLNYGTDDFTYSAWFNTESVQGTQQIVHKRSGNNYEVQLSGSWMVAYIGEPGNENSLFSGQISIDKWYHVLIGRTNGVATMYVNGVVVDTITATGSVTTTVPLYIGSDTGSEDFNGLIKDVAVWSHGLSDSAVTAIYNNGSPIDLTKNNEDYIYSDKLKGYWRLNGTSTIAKDLSGSANDGTIYGAESITSDLKSITSTFSGSSLTLLPDPNWNGQSIITVIADDKYSYDTTSFTLTVTPVQDPPSAFEWISSASNTISIDSTNLDSTYSLQWSESTDVDGESINYLIYAKIGLYPTEEVEEITGTAFQLVYEQILEQVFEGSPVNGATVRLNVKVTDGIDTVDVTGENRVLYINRYEYLSVENEGLPTEFALHENYPNPFNPSTTLRFDLPQSSDVNLTIYNMLGQKVKSFDMRGIQAGKHTLKWNATNDFGEKVGTGVYLYQLQTKDFMKTRKMIFMK